MFELRIHGRGGQGVVTAAELVSMAAFDEGRPAQAFPIFGSERTGAPVVAFCRAMLVACPVTTNASSTNTSRSIVTTTESCPAVTGTSSGVPSPLNVSRP